MKHFLSSTTRFGSRLALLALGLWLSSAPQALATGPGFSVAPSATDNQSTAPVTLTATGLNTGETVLIQKYSDANVNGIVDAGDVLVQSFLLTDNSATTFNGGTVTNTAIPGDSNPTNGIITTVLSAANNGLLPGFSGHFLFVLSSPIGRFLPITIPFTVTNSLSSQLGTITGTVSSGGSNVPYATVLLFMPSSGGNNAVGGTLANGSGNYAIAAPPGTYQLAAAKSNFVADLNAAASVVLTAGATNNDNLPLIAATQTISGRIYDTNTSVGLNGLLVPAEEKNSNLLAVCFTDTNGYFNVPVVNGTWKFSGESELAYVGYLKSHNRANITVSNANVVNVNLALLKANALIYGRIRDNLANPLVEVSLFGNDDMGNYDSSARTDQNGWYFLGTSSSSGMWQASIDNSQTIAFSYDFTQNYNSTNLSAGQALRQDFSAVLAPYQISGRVVSVNPLMPSVTNVITNVNVNAFVTINGTNYQATGVNTDNTGYYTMNVANGAWDVNVNCNGGNNSLSNLNYNCALDETVSISSNNGVANFNVPMLGSAELAGHVLNGSGHPVANLMVSAIGTNSNPSHLTTTTDANGFYEFIVNNDTWDVSLACSNLTSLGYSCVSDLMVGVGFNNNSPANNFTLQPAFMPFFTGQAPLGNNVYYLAGGNGFLFGYYSLLYYPYVYHYDMGWEYFIDANDGHMGAYLYDFVGQRFWYTSPTYAFPYLYDFTRNAVVYYFPDTNNAGRYTKNPRSYYDFNTHSFYTLP